MPANKVKSYVFDPDPVPALDWDTYQDLITPKWTQLVKAKRPENDYQLFLEQNPSFICPPLNPQTQGGHHGPILHAVISQPSLTGLRNEFRADFGAFIKDSARLILVLTEIETPAKKWFTKTGQQTAMFTQAYTQLAKWRIWFNTRGNSERFLEEYRIEDPELLRLEFKQHFVLVYGSQEEFDDNPDHTLNRQMFNKPDETICTFNRLYPRPELMNCCTVTIDKTGYRAKYFPPTFMLGPSRAAGYHQITEKESAIDRSPGIENARKNFLKKRFPYWESWANTPRQGFETYSYRDWE